MPGPVQPGQGTEHHGQKAHQAPALELALIIPQMPAVIGERLLLRVLFHYLDAGADSQPAPDLYIGQLLFPLGQGPVHQLREAGPKAVIHPVAGTHRQPGCLLGADPLFLVLQNLHGILPHFPWNFLF